VGVEEHLRNWRRWSRADTLATAGHWAFLGVMSVGLPIAAATRAVKTNEGAPWFTPAAACFFAGLPAVLIVVGAIVHCRRHPAALVVTTTLVMFLLQAVMMSGYVR